MNLTLLLRGLLLGFSIAAPVGPIGVLCIRRTLAGGRLVGLATGLGAATADAAYGLVAGLGLTAVASGLTTQQRWLPLIGGGFLMVLGVRTFLARPASQPAQASAAGLAGAYLSTLALTLTNPLTILSFAAAFAGLGLLGNGVGPAGGAALSLVVGVFLGSAAWWLLLSSLVHALRGRLGPGALGWVNRISGVVITGFGVAAIAAAL
jgi:threonine/homoserine/homoserine lactone efflux protein